MTINNNNNDNNDDNNAKNDNNKTMPIIIIMTITIKARVEIVVPTVIATIKKGCLLFFTVIQLFVVVVPF